MVDSNFVNEINKRRAFAIISHPDAGKTTVTEKLLLMGGAIQIAGTVKGRKNTRHATSDWMEIEKQRGISVTSSVMQFDYRDHVINLLDTPGHEDFSEDTYRTLTAVDSALMVIDVAKGVESRTKQLMDVCRLRDTPIVTFINKLDREGQDGFDLLDEIERVLKIKCAPATWPIGMGRRFRGIYHILTGRIRLFESRQESKHGAGTLYDSLDDPELVETLGPLLDELREEIELIEGAGHKFDHEQFMSGELTPVYFGSALNNFGISELLDCIVDESPGPVARKTLTRVVEPDDNKFTGFVFKIQANMDPSHRDRVAFLRICSGVYKQGMKVYQCRLGKQVQISNAMTFMAGARAHAEECWPGDIIGLHNHGTIQIGDTFTQGEDLKYTGIPHFAPDLFRRVVLRDPLKSKALLKGLLQLSEEGATQVFRPLLSNELIVGAIGVLQFDVVAWRLKNEYNVDCVFEGVQMAAARWVECEDEQEFQRFRDKLEDNLALDSSENYTYMAPTRVNLDLAQERWPNVVFRATKEL